MINTPGVRLSLNGNSVGDNALNLMTIMIETMHLTHPSSIIKHFTIMNFFLPNDVISVFQGILSAGDLVPYYYGKLTWTGEG